MVARAGTLAFSALAGASLFAIARRAGVGGPWALVPVVALVIPIHRGDQLAVCDPAFALVLASGAWLTGAWTRSPSAFVGGLLLGLAAVFRHDFGGYGAVAGMAALAWTRWRVAPAMASSVAWATVRSLAALAAGIAAVAVPVYGTLAVRGPRQLFTSLVEVPVAMMPYRALPYFHELRRSYWAVRSEGASADGVLAATQLAVFLTPLIALALLASLLLPGARRVATSPERSPGLVFLVAGAGATATYALGRSDAWHVYPLYVLSAGVASILAAGFWEAIAPRRWSRAGTAITAVLVALVVALVALAEDGQLAAAVPLGAPRAAGIVVPPNLLWVSAAVSDVARSAPGSILVASERHDRVHFDAVAVYFFSRRPSGTYYHDFVPGVTTRRDVQARIVQDLERNGVRTVLIWKARLPDERNLSRTSSGVRTLDDYLAAKFTPSRREEDYEVLRR